MLRELGGRPGRQEHERRRGSHVLEGDLSKILTIGKKPLYRLLESFPKCMFRAKSKTLLGPAHIQTSPGLSVGLGGVPSNLSGEIGLRGNHGGKVAYGDFLPCPQIDGLTPFIVLSGEQDAFCGILNIQKLSSRGSVSPQRECGKARFLRCDTFAN